MALDRLHSCESELRKVLQAVQSATDLSEVAGLYEDAKRSVSATLVALSGQPDDSVGETAREVMSLLLYLHLAYRTKEADCRKTPRLLAVR